LRHSRVSRRDGGVETAGAVTLEASRARRAGGLRRTATRDSNAVQLRHNPLLLGCGGGTGKGGVGKISRGNPFPKVVPASKSLIAVRMARRSRNA